MYFAFPVDVYRRCEESRRDFARLGRGVIAFATESVSHIKLNRYVNSSGQAPVFADMESLPRTRDDRIRQQQCERGLPR
jgi:hypothetical protein